MVDSIGGGAQPWGASIAINPFSMVDVRTGKVLTKIDVANVQPHGPPLMVNLYHNSQPSALAAPRPIFSVGPLGQNWRTSYSTYIRGNDGDPEVTLVHDNGDADVYTEHVSGSPSRDYSPPHGVYNDLRWDAEYGTEGAWVLTNPSQHQHYYVESDTAGIYRLETLKDSAGNTSTLDVSDQDFNSIIGAADNDGSPFNYSRIDMIDTGGLATLGFSILLSHLYSEYYWDGQNRTLFTTFENGFDTFVQMDANDRITELTERYPNGLVWTYEYYDDSPGDNSGRIKAVRDPDNAFAQEFEYERLANGYFATHYTDRRSFEWVYEFDAAGNLVKLTEPYGASPGYSRTQKFDTQHNRLASTDELGHTWTYTYGAVGNVATVASPLTGSNSQTWTYTWNQPSGALWNFFRLAEVADPLNHWVAFEYNFAEDPTLVTCIREASAASGGSEGVTHLGYYSSADNVIGTTMASGHLKSVTDSNGSQTAFEYDSCGFPSRTDAGIPVPPAECKSELQAGGSRKVLDGPQKQGSNDVTGKSLGGSDSGGGVSDNEYGSGGQLEKVLCSNILTLSRGNPFLERFGVMPAAQPQVIPLKQCTSIGYIDWRPFRNDVCIQRHNDQPTEQYDIINFNTDINFHSASEDSLQRIEEIANDFDWSSFSSTIRRAFEFEYNESPEPSEVGCTQINPPAGSSIVYKRANGDRGFDALGRPEVVERGSMRNTYTYDAAGRVTQEQFHTLGSPGNSAGRVARTFDNANRLTSISMYDGADALMIKYVYTWNKDNTVQYRDELQTATQNPPWCRTTFSHDTRKRLVYEKRVEDSVTIYEFEYHYDQLGNRLSKIDLLNEVQTDYYYDVDVQGTLQADSDVRLTLSQEFLNALYTKDDGQTVVDTSDSRLIYYIERPVEGDAEDITREVWYTYYQMGNPAHIVVKDAGDDKYHGLAMYYATNQSLWRVLWDEWEGGRYEFDDYRVLGATSGEPKPREFYYNGVGGRYLTRPMQVTGNAQNGYDWDPIMTGTDGKDQFADTLGLLPSGDFQSELVSSPSAHWVLTDSDQYLRARGLKGRDRVGSAEEFWFADLAGSAVRTTEGDGAQGYVIRYTAFGEPIQSNGDVGGTLPAGSSRYGYVSAQGYENGTMQLAGASGSVPLLLSHVGARWYAPSIGRFAARDPIDLGGGLNPYRYVNQSPLSRIDPNGLCAAGDEVDDIIRELKNTRRNNWTDMTGRAGEAFLGLNPPNLDGAKVYAKYGPLEVGFGGTGNDGAFFYVKCAAGGLGGELTWSENDGWELDPDFSAGPVGTNGETVDVCAPLAPLPGGGHLGGGLIFR